MPIFPREVEKTLKLVLDSIGEGVPWAVGRAARRLCILVSCTARALLDDTQRVVGGVAVFREITAQRRAEVELQEERDSFFTTFAAARDVTQLRAAQEALKASLAEKEVLLKEIHHRVKNNLQVISSLLKLHGEQVADPLAKAAFEDSQDRVRSIALLHEQLYQSKNLGSVSAADCAGSLVQTLMRTHGSLAVARVSIDAPGVFLSVDLALPCGLILNELVTNSLKHAFVQRVEPSPEIRIAMSADGQELALSVSDNGVGLPGDFDLSKSQSLGMQLVRTLARQLRAEVTMTGAGGTHWSFRFPRQLSGRQEF